MSLTNVILFVVAVELGLLMWALWGYTPIDDFMDEPKPKKTKAKK